MSNIFIDFKKLTYHGSFFVTLDNYDVKKAYSYLTNIKKVKYKKLGKTYELFILKNNFRVVLKKNTYESIIEIYIESYSKEEAENLNKELSTFIIG
jgi:hypothetical protein